MVAVKILKKKNRLSSMSVGHIARRLCTIKAPDATIGVIYLLYLEELLPWLEKLVFYICFSSGMSDLRLR
jgi:hypothetical protein